jgi:hypothetical protein
MDARPLTDAEQLTSSAESAHSSRIRGGASGVAMIRRPPKKQYDAAAGSSAIARVPRRRGGALSVIDAPIVMVRPSVAAIPRMESYETVVLELVGQELGAEILASSSSSSSGPLT